MNRAFQIWHTNFHLISFGNINKQNLRNDSKIGEPPPSLLFRNFSAKCYVRYFPYEGGVRVEGPLKALDKSALPGNVRECVQPYLIHRNPMWATEPLSGTVTSGPSPCWLSENQFNLFKQIPLHLSKPV